MAGLRERVGRVRLAAAVLAGLAALLIAVLFVGVVPSRPGSGVFAVLLLVVSGCLWSAGNTAGIVAAAEQRARRMEQLAGAVGRLMRLRDPAAIVAYGETLARDLLACDQIAITLDDAPLPDAPAGAAQQRQPLRSAAGDLLGRIAVVRRAGPPFSPADAQLLAELGRAIAGALDTARLLAEVTQARAEVELILGTISDGMIVLDTAWLVRYVNAAALRYLRRPRAGMLGASIWQLFPGLAGSEFAERMQDAVRRRQDADFAAVFPPLDAWFEARCYPFDGGLTVYFRDVTAQRYTEERLRQSQRLEALGQLTGGIAHDVNNLLTVILGNFEMLALGAEERGLDGAADYELAEAGLRAGTNASKLMHRLLAFSRRQPLSPQTVDVSALFGGLEPLLRRSIGETVTLTIGVPDGLWRALADPAELENALINLAINARDAMPSGGQLSIEAANVAIDHVYAAIAGMERIGDFVMIAVADDGGGMTGEVMERAFDPFFTTKEPGKGTGLGLSMVYGFARQSGGHVMIDSEPGQGTIVRLYLPRTAGVAASPQEPEEADEIRGGNETILLVEDNDLVRAHTAAMLRGLGYAVHTAADGKEALALLREAVQPDLLLTDVVLPGGLSGRQLADAAAALLPGLRVLFTSGYPGSGLLQGGRVRPGVQLISKPFRRSELAATVRAQLAAVPWRPTSFPPLAAGAETC